MALSQIAICNAALYKLGADRITSLGDDVKAARMLTDIWDRVLDTELSKYTWNFAVRRASLAALVGAPAFGFSLWYQLPSDFLSLVQVGDYYVVSDLSNYRGGPNPPYAIEGGKILTDLPAPLHIRYIARITDTTLFNATFCEALACQLAAEMAESLTQSNSKRQLALAEYAQALKDARRRNALDVPTEKLPDGEWVIGRL